MERKKGKKIDSAYYKREYFTLFRGVYAHITNVNRRFISIIVNIHKKSREEQERGVSKY